MSTLRLLPILADWDVTKLFWAGQILAIAVPTMLLLAVYLELGGQGEPRPGSGAPRRVLHALLCTCLCLAIANAFVNSHVGQSQALRLRQAEAVAAAAQGAIEQGRRELLGLQRSLAVRDVRLPSAYDPMILRSIKGVNVELASTPYPEPMRVAESIRTVAEFAGWNVVGSEQSVDASAVGIRIKIPVKLADDDRSPQARDALVSILGENGVVAAVDSEELPPNTMRIEIGSHEPASSPAIMELNPETDREP
jgi:hypothetical protein